MVPKSNNIMEIPSRYPVIPRQPRQKPMRVLALGLSRTGTMSTWVALNKLGYTTYHGLECSLDAANGSLEFWGAAIEAKIAGSPSQPTTAKDFDAALWRYDAITDTPSVLFAEELLAAYPDAKVILTERDVDSWLASMQRSYYRILSRRALHVLKVLDVGFVKKYYPIFVGTLHIWTGGDIHNTEKLKEGYLKHYEKIRAIVPKERLLEWHAKDGWEPLCAFLDKSVPEGTFPKVNQDTMVADLHDKMLIGRSLAVFFRLLKMVSPLVVVGLAWWFLRGSA